MIFVKAFLLTLFYNAQRMKNIRFLKIIMDFKTFIYCDFLNKHPLKMKKSLVSKGKKRKSLINSEFMNSIRILA